MKNEKNISAVASDTTQVRTAQKQIQIPTWLECCERVDNFERTDRTVAMALQYGSELNPLENMVYHYDDASSSRSQKFMVDLKKLVEWCINNPEHVLAKHEKI